MKKNEISLVQKFIKNFSLDLIKQYNQLMLLPFILLISYFVFLYKFVYLAYVNFSINVDFPYMIQFVIYILLLVPGLIVIIPLTSVLTNIFVHSIVKKVVTLPINIELMFKQAERCILVMLFPLFMSYILMTSLALDLNLTQFTFPVLLMMISLVLIKTINLIFFLITNYLANVFKRMNFQLYYYLFFLNILYSILLIEGMNWLQKDLENRSVYVWIVLSIVFFVFFIRKGKVTKWYSINYLLEESANKKIASENFKSLWGFELLLMMRHFRMYTDFYFICILMVIIAFKFIHLSNIDTTFLSICLSTIMAPASLAIREYYHHDLNRYPVRKTELLLFHVCFSFLITSGVFVLFTYLTNDYLKKLDLVVWFFVFCSMLLLQSVMKIKLHKKEGFIFFIVFSITSQLFTYFYIQLIL